MIIWKQNMKIIMVVLAVPQPSAVRIEGLYSNNNILGF